MKAWTTKVREGRGLTVDKKVQILIKSGILNVLGSWGTHITNEKVLVVLEQSPGFGVLEGEVLDDVKGDWGVGGLENIYNSS